MENESLLDEKHLCYDDDWCPTCKTVTTQELRWVAFHMVAICVVCKDKIEI